MSRIGIVGHEDSKFTMPGRLRAMACIADLLSEGDTVVSGGCHLGGVDIWAEEIAATMGLETMIFKPTRLSWDPGEPWIGYKARNIAIAAHSAILHVIVVKTLPGGYQGMKHPLCYHCNTTTHIKSGGCWTGKHAQAMGVPVVWWEIDNT